MPRNPSRSRSAPSKHAGLPLATKDSPSAADARKRARVEAKRDFEYLEWVHLQPCVVCGAVTVEAHHHPYRSKPNWHDHSTVSLCPTHHRGATGIHYLGERKFQEMHGISLLGTALEMRGRYVKENA